MNPRTRRLVVPSLLTLGGCSLIRTVIAVPFVLLGAVVSILVSSEGLSLQEELHAGGIRIDRYEVEYHVAADQGYEGSVEIVRTVTGTAGLADAQMAAQTFDPRCQTLELEAAEVIGADGVRHAVAADGVFTRPSVAAQNAPAFLATQTRTVVFPQLRVGAQTRVKWHFAQSQPSPLGFQFAWRPMLTLPVGKAEIRIDWPDGVPLRFAASAPFRVEERQVGGRHVVAAVLEGYAGQAAEKAMVDPRDVCPGFVASTTERWESLGARFHEAIAGKAEVTPEIRELAGRIVGERTGLAAAQAIHRWVAVNVQYVAVYLGRAAGWVPHPASEVMRHGYGDCKDQFVLLAALLAARGIEAVPVLIDYDRSFVPYPLPTPLQFDHCLAYLPQFDVYSDPTDPHRDLGELDLRLCGKFAVLATEAGRTVRTPEASADADRVRVEQTMEIGGDGRVKGHARLEFAGRPAGRFRREFARAGTAEEAADELLATTLLGGEGQLRTSPLQDLGTPLTAEADWAAELPLATGGRMRFLLPTGCDPLGIARLLPFVGPEVRRTPLLLPAMTTTSRREVKLPEGYTFAGLPEGRAVQNAAGSYTSSYERTATGSLVVQRTLRIERDRFAPAEYPALRAVLVEACLDLSTVLVAERAK